MMVDMIWQLPRIEETDKIDLIALEAPDKLGTATIEGSKVKRVSEFQQHWLALGNPLHENAIFSAMSQCVATSNSCAYGAVCCQANE